MSVGERILKIDQHLAKLWAKNMVAPFPGHGVFRWQLSLVVTALWIWTKLFYMSNPVISETNDLSQEHCLRTGTVFVKSAVIRSRLQCT